MQFKTSSLPEVDSSWSVFSQKKYKFGSESFFDKILIKLLMGHRWDMVIRQHETSP